MSPDVLVVGGGPAGSAAARLLALWGHDVRLITRPSFDASATLAESLPPSCRKLFDILGVRDALDRAGFVRSTGNTVWWGRGDTRVEHFAHGERGWQITADALSALLLDAARTAGVSVEHARVTAEAVMAAPQSVVLDCSGRSGVVARARGWRVYEPALRTVALVAAWRHRAEWPLTDPSHTLIESYADGWVWSVPVADGRRYIAAMVDPRASNLADGSSRDIYLTEIGKTQRIAYLLSRATLEDGPWGWDASMYASTCYADERVLLVGDAASFVDPLSSAGVKKALASGWLAAVAAHTALVDPSRRRLAFDFFAAREREIYESLRSMTQHFLAAAAVGHANPFWTDRALEGESREDAVESAFARLRQAARLTVQKGNAIRVEDRPAVNGCEIVLERRLVGPQDNDGVGYLHDVNIVALVDLAPSFDDVGALFAEYTRRHGPVALPDFLRALATALAREWLVWV